MGGQPSGAAPHGDPHQSAFADPTSAARGDRPHIWRRTASAPVVRVHGLLRADALTERRGQPDAPAVPAHPHVQVEDTPRRTLTLSEAGPTVRRSHAGVIRPVTLHGRREPRTHPRIGVRPAGRAATVRTGAAGRRRDARAAGSAVPELRRPRRLRGLSRAYGVHGRRHHLPAARLLGPHRAGGTERARRQRVGQPTAVLVQRHPGAEGGQAAPGHRRLTAEHPGAVDHLRTRDRRPRRRHALLRRRHRLRVHLGRGGRRPAAGGRACSASPSPARSASCLASWPSCRPSGSTAAGSSSVATTSSRCAGRPAPPAELSTHTLVVRILAPGAVR